MLRRRWSGGSFLLLLLLSLPAAAPSAQEPGTAAEKAAEQALEPDSPEAAGSQAPGIADGTSSPEKPAPSSFGIKWLPFQRDSFNVAATLRRPVLLYLRAADCRLCAVNEREVLSSPLVAKWIRQRAVPVAVDVDLRPDIGDRYVLGLVPTLALLLPNGEPIYNVEKDSSLERVGGYFDDAEDLHEYLQSATRYFRANKMDLVAKAKQVAEIEARVRTYEPGDPPFQRLDDLVQKVRDHFDFTHGGYGRKLKLIHDAPYRLFAWVAQEEGNDLLARAVLTTAEKLLQGEIHDAVEGGFHHYAVRRDWSLPAREKRLDVNARAIRILVAATRLAPDRPEFADGVRSTAKFILGTLRRQDGMFALSQQGALGPDDPGSYFRADAEGRKTLRPPALNDVVIASANAEAVVALLEAADLLQDAALRDAALQALDALQARLYRRGRGLYRYVDVGGNPRMEGLLIDQVGMLEALLAAHATRGKKEDLQTAQELLAFIDGNLMHENGYYIDRVSSREAIGLLRRPRVSLELNGRMAQALQEMAGRLDSAELARQGRQVLGGLVSQAEKLGWRDASYVQALLLARPAPATPSAAASPAGTGGAR